MIMNKITISLILLITAPLLAISQDSSLQERNKAAIRKQFDHSNSGDKNAIISDWSDSMANFGLAGKAMLTKAVDDIYTTFPDWRLDLVDMVAEGDYVVARVKASGTHLGVGKLAVNKGVLIGIAPTKKHFVADHIHWYKLKDGKIVEHWATRDDIEMMRQLGLLPPVAQPK
jgi:predicted ester cyclase